MTTGESRAGLRAGGASAKPPPRLRDGPQHYCTTVSVTFSMEFSSGKGAVHVFPQGAAFAGHMQLARGWGQHGSKRTRSGYPRTVVRSRVEPITLIGPTPLKEAPWKFSWAATASAGNTRGHKGGSRLTAHGKRGHCSPSRRVTTSTCEQPIAGACARAHVNTHTRAQHNRRIDLATANRHDQSNQAPMRTSAWRRTGDAASEAVATDEIYGVAFALEQRGRLTGLDHHPPQIVWPKILSPRILSGKVSWIFTFGAHGRHATPPWVVFEPKWD